MTKAHTQPCPVAQMLNVVGDRWTLLILRDAFYGATRFSEFERRSGIAKNILSARLASLIREGLMQQTQIGKTGSRVAYGLTDKGRSLLPVLVAMFQWGQDHLFADGTAPVRIVEKTTGKDVAPLSLTSRSGRPLGQDDIAVLFTAPSNTYKETGNDKNR